ncbi:probable protein phosphatase 2C 68 [Cryptomeria japonica]|uniref:probable protein phosphatase 2C 68 n=1 Tax=Cryptomeria japonica TaxID=3369 RepID=UPI0025ABB9EA|nr:probable protein phosphatase 2C 68 [Cryptomeria japonica]
MEGPEICCRSIVDDKHVSPGERKSCRMARRRRMEIRKLKLVATSGVVAVAVGAEAASYAARKRIKLSKDSVCCSSDCARECDNAVDSSALDNAGLKSGNGEQGRDRVCAPASKVDSGGLEKSVILTPEGSSGSTGNCYENFACPEHGMVTFCGRRREMEDAVSILPAFNCGKDEQTGGALHFFGVYDGHGGSQAAFFCKERLHEVLVEEMKARGDLLSETQWQTAMKNCFSRVDTEVLSGGLRCKNDCIASGGSECSCEQTITSETVGTTAVVALVGAHQIVVANCGDSRAVLSRGGTAIPLSVDHKPDRPDEISRIESAGGRVIFWNGPRVFGVLAMSRAIGDKYLKPYVISEPEVTITDRIDEDECLILASDGLWDVLSNELVCDVARKCLSGRLPGGGLRSMLGNGDESPSAAAAALLTKLALAKGSADNISVVVVDLGRKNSRR